MNCHANTASERVRPSWRQATGPEIRAALAPMSTLKLAVPLVQRKSQILSLRRTQKATCLLSLRGRLLPVIRRTLRMVKRADIEELAQSILAQELETTREFVAPLLGGAQLAHMAVQDQRVKSSEWQVGFEFHGVVHWASMARSAEQSHVLRELSSTWTECFHSQGIFYVHPWKGEMGTAVRFCTAKKRAASHEEAIRGCAGAYREAVRFIPQKPVLRTEDQIVDTPSPQSQKTWKLVR